MDDTEQTQGLEQSDADSDAACEPTSATDQAAEERMLRLLAKLHKRCYSVHSISVDGINITLTNMRLKP
jgi:hypothetical protein